MKRLIQLLVVSTVLAMSVAATPISVDFASLDQPHNIGQQIAAGPIIVQNSHSIDGVTFSYESDPMALDPAVVAGALCGFDAGVGGLQGVPGCVGAQVDTGGLFGTTDGSLILRFASPASAMMFSYQLVAWDEAALSQEFGLTATFFLGGTFVDAASSIGSAPVALIDGFLVPVLSLGDFAFTPGVSFDLAVINFSPTGQPFDFPIFGMTTFGVNAITYEQVPEPATFGLMICGGLLLGATRMLRRKA